MAFPCDNIILITDSYKVSHYLQYPPNTTKLYSYFECRGGKFSYSVFFGLQYIIKRWLEGPVITKEKIIEAKNFCQQHFGQSIFNEKGWLHILNEHNGCLPIRIKAIPEGSVVETGNVLFTVENTDPQVAWLTNWLETLLLQCWYPITVATLSRCQKQLLGEHLLRTSDSLDPLSFQLHDFGFRGVSSVEQAAIGGASHLVNFKGTDTIAGVLMVRKYYCCEMAGFSVPATEHSTMTTWAALSDGGETEACNHMISTFPNGIISVVSDSFDIFDCCERIWGNELRAQVIERGNKDGNVLVIRPDSGDPTKVLPKVLEILGKSFGYSVNSKGYKMLPNFIRIIQGDGINYESLRVILAKIEEAGWSSSNLVFGSGGSLLQRLDRDTQKCAFKCSYAVINGKGVDVFKDPVTDRGKTSKKGILTLQKIKNDDGTENYMTFEEGTGDPTKDLLITVFENGKLLKEYSFDEVRENAKIMLGDNRV